MTSTYQILPTTSRKLENFVFPLIWIGVSVLSWYLIYMKYLALGFHTRDYSFYTEFIVRFNKPSAEQYFSINPGGYNFLGGSAVDGCSGFYQWIHFEPLRFIHALIFKITHSVQAIFLFNTLLICSPVLSIPYWLKQNSAGLGEKLGWILFFIAFPSMLMLAGYDNRPSMFLGIGYFWILFFFLATKNKTLQYVSFLFLFLVREEALILNGVVCFYLFLQLTKKQIRVTQFLQYLIPLVFYAVVLVVYYRYWGTDLFRHKSIHYSFHILAILFLVCCASMYVAYIKNKLQRILFLPIVFFLFQLISMHQAKMFPDVGYFYFNDPRNSFWFTTLFALFLYIRSNVSKSISSLGAVITILFLVFPLFYKHHLLSTIRQFQSKQVETDFIFDAKKQIAPGDVILTDYTTHQAFIGMKNLYCFDRFPCTIDKTALRFFPDNLIHFHRVIDHGTWVVVTHSSFERLKTVYTVDDSEILSKNNQYIVLRTK